MNSFNDANLIHKTNLHKGKYYVVTIFQTLLIYSATSSFEFPFIIYDTVF